MVEELRRADDRRHRGQNAAQGLVTLDGNHHVVFIRLQRLDAFTVERVLTVRPRTTELLAIVQHLRTCLVQLELQRLDLLHVTHAVEMVRHLVVAEHHKRMARRVRDFRRLNQEACIGLIVVVAIGINRKRRDRVPLNVVELDHLGVRQRTLVGLIHPTSITSGATVSRLRAPRAPVGARNAGTLSC